MRFVLVFILFFSASALAQVPSREQLVGSALEDFGKVAGTWYLNVRCSFLSAQETSRLELDVAEINTALASDIGNPTLLISIQRSAREVVYSDKYKSCDAEVRSMFDAGLEHTQHWAKAIREIKSRQSRPSS